MRRGRRGGTVSRRGWLTAYLFLAPGLLLFAAFRLYPAARRPPALLHQRAPGPPAQAFVGLANYERLLEDTRFHTSLWNTAFYTVASTLPILAIPLLLAVALNRGPCGPSCAARSSSPSRCPWSRWA